MGAVLEGKFLRLKVSGIPRRFALIHNGGCEAKGGVLGEPSLESTREP
jgi:hypothetical protein